LSFFSWFFLSSVFLLNNISAGQDRWIQLCTQQGVQMVNLSQQSDSSSHKADPCQCTTDEVVAVGTITLMTGSASLSISQYYDYFQISLAYRPLNPRAPPINAVANA